jgi:hypothetical protein
MFAASAKHHLLAGSLQACAEVSADGARAHYQNLHFND